ncbi:MAG: sensor histidine kinase, partial [Proteobacteria bacterium]|nr:sensor histidine kinase [Pseudomonadota bacterium]
MKFFETSKYFSLKKSTYTTLRWIGILGQLISINLVYFLFDLRFDFLTANLIILVGILSNFYLVF